jgi:cryptochrome
MAAAAASSSSSSAAAAVSLHWFRKGLRLHDNPALVAALAGGATTLKPLFILDPHFARPDVVGTNRYGYLLECLRDLDASLRARGSRLLVVKGAPSDVLPAVVRAWGVTRVTWERDVEPYARARDAALTAALTRLGVSVTLWDPDAVVRRAPGGRVPTAYGSFLKLVEGMPKPAAPLDAPAALPPVGPVPFPPGLPRWAPKATGGGGGSSAAAAADGSSSSSSAAGAGASSGSSSSSSATVAAAPSHHGNDDTADVDYGVPSLAQLGYEPAGHTTSFTGGESGALASLAHHLSRRAWLAGFSKPDTSPTGLTPDTTALSPALKFGTLSCRTFYHGLAGALAAHGGQHTQPPVSLTGQLLWRDFYYANAAAYANYDRMEGNPICRQVPWDYSPGLLAAWAEGRTGYPWIDACMAQLRTDGWLHHLGRHAVACFLTRGDLWQSWEHGAKVFDRLLVDADWALNSGNWMWLSASAYFHQYFRVYSPVAFPKVRGGSASCGAVRVRVKGGGMLQRRTLGTYLRAACAASSPPPTHPRRRRRTPTATTCASGCRSSATSRGSGSTSRGTRRWRCSR